MNNRQRLKLFIKVCSSKFSSAVLSRICLHAQVLFVLEFVHAVPVSSEMLSNTRPRRSDACALRFKSRDGQ